MQAVTSFLAPDAFSLFHFSPVPEPDEALEGKAAEEAERPGYQLFGSVHSKYPLAPLGAVLSL